MTDAGSEVSSQEVPDGGWFARRRRGLLAVVVATVMVVVAVWLGLALAGSESKLDDQPTLSPETDAGLDSIAGRRYSDENLGIDDLIEVEITPFEARYRDLAEWEVPYDARQRYLEEEAVGHERERLYFERNVEWLLSSEYEELPADLGRGGTLDRAFEEAMDECAAASGYEGVVLYDNPDVDPERYQNDGAGLLAEELARFDSYESDFGLDRESYLELRHECAKRAALYPTLDPVVRDELLGRLREHYRAAVYEYLREFPDAEVPLVDHPGAPRPLEDRLIGICLKTLDPAQCAVEFRVELPAE